MLAGSPKALSIADGIEFAEFSILCIGLCGAWIDEFSHQGCSLMLLVLLVPVLVGVRA